MKQLQIFLIIFNQHLRRKTINNKTNFYNLLLTANLYNLNFSVFITKFLNFISTSIAYVNFITFFLSLLLEILHKSLCSGSTANNQTISLYLCIFQCSLDAIQICVIGLKKYFIIVNIYNIIITVLNIVIAVIYFY